MLFSESLAFSSTEATLFSSETVAFSSEDVVFSFEVAIFPFSKFCGPRLITFGGAGLKYFGIDFKPAMASLF